MSSLGLENLSSHTKSKDPFYFPPPKIDERILQGHETTIHFIKLFDSFVKSLTGGLDRFMKESLLEIKSQKNHQDGYNPNKPNQGIREPFQGQQLYL